MVPPVTVSPAAASTGTDSPVIMRPVYGGLAGQDLAVGGDPLPRADHETLARPQPTGRDALLGVVVAEHAHVLGPGRRQVTHGLPGGAPGPGLIQAPASRNVVTEAATSR